MRKFIENNGGRILTRHKVDKILVEKGRVRGVKVKDKIFRSPIVVVNVNAKKAFLKLIGEEKLDREFANYIKNL